LDPRERVAEKLAPPRNQRGGPDPVPSLPRGLEVSAKEWEDAWIAVLTYGLRVTGSLDRAHEVRQEAYVRLLTTRPWTPARGTPFLRHMLLVASSVRKHADKSAARRQRYEADGGHLYKRERGEAEPSPEQEMLEHRQRERRDQFAARVLAELRSRLEGFPLELALIERAAKQIEAREAQGAADDDGGGDDRDEEGDDDDGEDAAKHDDEPEKPADIARALGVPVEDVYRASARIRRYKESVIATVRRTFPENDDDESEDGSSSGSGSEESA
jgi:hypothetical protein